MTATSTIATPITFSGPEAVAAAREHVASQALVDGPLGTVGLELELHLVDLARPGLRPTWEQVQHLVAGVPPLPSGSAVTLEPGGQVELSTPPRAEVLAAVVALQRDEVVIRRYAAAHELGLAPLGTDPARPPRRINPGARYAAMERHFEALSTGGSGLQMMTSTAALQVNLDAGPRAGWRSRLDLARSLVPVLVALSSTSPHLGGTTSGWHSMRQGTWHGIDHGRSDPMRRGDPAEAWADYALSAPLLLVRDGESMAGLTRRVTFADWLAGHGPVDRAPTAGDLDYHLSTLFPPVRPRGYVEIRCLDAMPDRWWPALAALTATLLDDPVAADLVAPLLEPVADAWESASRGGLDDPALRSAAVGCVAVALERAPHPFRAGLDALAELLESGRTPSGLLRERIAQVGAEQVLREEAEDVGEPFALPDPRETAAATTADATAADATASDDTEGDRR